MNGVVLKGVGSYYTVLADDGEKYVCRPRGRFRIDKVSPLPGDRVDFECGSDEGYLLEIHPRKNVLTRPAIANVDMLLIVISAALPKADLLLADKLMLHCELCSIKPVVVINKCDATDDVSRLARQYERTGYELHTVSALTGQGIDNLRAAISNGICCLCGQSAAGKSSIINALIPELGLEVGGLSRKTSRGRHTTRHAELIPLRNDAMVVDTPGFSLLDTDVIEPGELCALYPEMRGQIGSCRFAGCLHLHEPDCAVKAAVNSGAITPERYERYKLILQELIEKRRRAYD
ncbi:MAG: ribosome small subunit-dependent GTPase A [Clostridia bacterium]|nr:ribosome small subunit-dependent GTPase A [Clostridia bacterium]